MKNEKNIFVNISNHPSTKWTEKQIKAAEKFLTHGEKNKIIDIQFPDINPNWNTAQVEDKAKEVFEKIKSIEGIEIVHTIVHIMGEMGFTYSLVRMCRNAFLACVHSTTQRKVVEVYGKKVVEFEFVKFRHY